MPSLPHLLLLALVPLAALASPLAGGPPHRPIRFKGRRQSGQCRLKAPANIASALPPSPSPAPSPSIDPSSVPAPAPSSAEQQAAPYVDPASVVASVAAPAQDVPLIADKQVVSDPAPAPAATSAAPTPAPAAAQYGLIALPGAWPCSPPTVDNGPNGAQSWLNQGLDGAGWNPPMVQISDLVVADLATVLADPNSVYHPCQPYVDIFYSAAADVNIPPIMLAATAMQESTCDPWVEGKNKEAGMMQLGSENCKGSENLDGGCYNIDFNIRQGAKYIQTKLNDHAGNILVSLGAYNGWWVGMTYADATAARWTNCASQNNLDYLQQLLNGWYQGISGHGLGVYQNVANC